MSGCLHNMYKVPVHPQHGMGEGKGMEEEEEEGRDGVTTDFLSYCVQSIRSASPCMTSSKEGRLRPQIFW